MHFSVFGTIASTHQRISSPIQMQHALSSSLQRVTDLFFAFSLKLWALLPICNIEYSNEMGHRWWKQRPRRYDNFSFLSFLSYRGPTQTNRKKIYERLPSSNEVEKKDKWVRRNVHFLRKWWCRTNIKRTRWRWWRRRLQQRQRRTRCRWNIEKVWNKNCRLMWTNRRAYIMYIYGSAGWYVVRWNRKNASE